MCCVPPFISPFASIGMTHSFSLQSLPGSVITDTGLKLFQFDACHPPLLKPYSSYVIKHGAYSFEPPCLSGWDEAVGDKPVAWMGGTSKNKSGYGQSLDIPEINCLITVVVFIYNQDL